jgi:N-acetylneuraminic acid mutarotase
MPHARESEAAAVLDGRIVVAGGKTTSTGLRTRAIYVIDPRTHNVSLGGLLPVALSGMVAVEGANEVFVAGGSPGNGQASAAVYSIRLRA